MELNAAYFQRYDEQQRELSSLATADNDLARAKSLLHSAKKAEAATRHDISKNHQELELHKKKVAKYSNDGFFTKTVFHPETWFSGGVDDKLHRNEAKVEKESKEEKELEFKERSLLDQIDQLQHQVAHLSDVSAHKAQLAQEATSLFEAAVATAPTAQLGALQQQAAGFREHVHFERTNAAIVQQVAELCAQARQHYYNAMRALDAAQRTNRGAQVNNVLGGRRGGMEMVETMQQARRDQEMRVASREAEQGGMVLQQAFAHVPAAARQRYPQLCRGLGEVHVPSVEQMGLGSAMMEVFGGDLVDAMVAMRAGRKIQEGLQALAGCEQIVAQQEGLVQALLAAMQRDGDRASAQLQATNGQILAEKQRIFAGLRAAAGGTAVAVAVAAPTQGAIQAAFQVFDTKGQGFISRDELVAILTRPTASSPISKHDAGMIFAAADTNGDGRVDYNEFAAAWGQNASLHLAHQTVPGVFVEERTTREHSAARTVQKRHRAKGGVTPVAAAMPLPPGYQCAAVAMPVATPVSGVTQAMAASSIG